MLMLSNIADVPNSEIMIIHATICRVHFDSTYVVRIILTSSSSRHRRRHCHFRRRRRHHRGRSNVV